MFNAANIDLITTINPPNGVIRFLKWLNDDRIVWGTYNSDIVFWNTTNQSVIHTITYTSPLFSLELLSNGYLASGAEESFIKLWNTTTYSMVQSITTAGIAYSIKQLSNGNMITAGADTNVTIWNTTTYTKLIIMSGHTQLIIVLELLSDGCTILSGSFDYTVKVWNTTSGRLLNTFNPTDQNINFIRQLPNGIVAVATNIISFWQINGNNSIEQSNYFNFSSSLVVYALEVVNCNTLAAGRSDSIVVFIDTDTYSIIDEIGLSNTGNPIFTMELVGMIKT